MFKVVVVDDEPIVRKGIVNIINWKAMGCEIVGEAANGVEGMQLIEKFKPDIILTDIHMPEIDGVEMIRRSLELIPWSKIIVLTGYRDFDYIQDALKLGASEYLLKPSKIDEITNAVKKACLELEFQNRRDENIKQLEDHYKKTLPLLKEKLLFDMVINSSDSTHSSELELYGIEINEFVMVSIDLNHNEKLDIYQKQLYKIGIKNAFLDIFEEGYDCQSIDITPSRFVFILQSDKFDFKEDVFKKAESFQLIIKSCFDIEMTLGISSEGQGYEELFKKMKECEMALSYKLYLGDDALILYDDIKALTLMNEDFNFQNLKNNINAAIEIGNVKLLKELNDQLQAYVNESNYKEFYLDLLLSITDQTKGELEEILKTSFTECHQIYLESSMKVVQSKQDINQKSLSNVLKQSLDYIRDNYQTSISLQDLADYTYVSTYYLSRMFKKEIGKNFVEYLNDYRIKKAKKHLEDFELKTYEIAELVGIPDPHYFSKLFKKHTGITPTDYRNQVTNDRSN